MWQPYPDFFNFIIKLSMYNEKNIAEMTRLVLPRYINENIGMIPMRYVPSV